GLPQARPQLHRGPAEERGQPGADQGNRGQSPVDGHPQHRRVHPGRRQHGHPVLQRHRLRRGQLPRAGRPRDELRLRVTGSRQPVTGSRILLSGYRLPIPGFHTIYATTLERSAAMRSSSGGWLMNSRFRPWARPPEMPNACTALGSVLTPWLRDSASSAEIILPRPARLAPPASARNSRRRENHIAIMLANKPNTISSTNTTTK